MIENKHLSFIQKNTIENRWAILKEANLKFPYNSYCCKINIPKDTSQAITSCEEIRLILSEPCLSSGILIDIRWVCTYGIKLRLVAKNEQIVAEYSYLPFTEVRIDPDVCINYLGIHGPKPLYLAIGDDYTKTSNSIEQYYFDSVDKKTSFFVFDEVERVLIVDEKGEFDDNKFFSACHKRNISINYIVSSMYFNQEIAEKFPPYITLLVSEHVVNAILFIKKFGDIYLFDIKARCLFSQVENVHSYFGELFLSTWGETKDNITEIPSETYFCEGGKIIHLSIEEEKVIEKELCIATMDDFITEKFDRSIEESHNKYCLKAFQIRYNYTLIPPLYGCDYIVSSIYNGAKSIYQEWLQDCISIVNFIETLKEIKQENEFINVYERLEEIHKKLAVMIQNDEYIGFHKTVRSGVAIIDEILSHYIEEWKNIFRVINRQDSGNKFDRFDKEIAGYQEMIEEKQKLVNQGIEVLNNKRRIEVLKSKIADLESLKSKFIETSSTRDVKVEEEFAKRCNDILNGEEQKKENARSLENVIKQVKLTNTQYFEQLVEKWMLPLKTYFTDAKYLFEKLDKQDFPETYKVYEKLGQRYIVIDDLSEYESTSAMRDKYQIQCLARRDNNE